MRQTWVWILLPVDLGWVKRLLFPRSPPCKTERLRGVHTSSYYEDLRKYFPFLWRRKWGARFRKNHESRSIYTDMEQSLRFIIEQGKVRVRTNGGMCSVCIFLRLINTWICVGQLWKSACTQLNNDSLWRQDSLRRNCKILWRKFKNVDFTLYPPSYYLIYFYHGCYIFITYKHWFILLSSV